MSVKVWGSRIKILLISACIASVANYIFTSRAGNAVTPLEAVPGFLFLIGCALAGCLIHEAVSMVLPKNLPNIVYMSLVAVLLSVPGLFPFSDYCIAQMDKIELMSVITTLMAYTGISIGKDLGSFKQQGPAIIVVSLITFFGTFIGSVLIAQTVLGLSGLI